MIFHLLLLLFCNFCQQNINYFFILIFQTFNLNSFPLFPHVAKIIKALSGPKYDGKYLHKLVREKLGDTKLHQTLTNVVIPTFDIQKLQPTIFSSYEVNSQPDY